MEVHGSSADHPDFRLRAAPANEGLLSVSVSELLSRGRTCYARNEWNDAFEALSQADQSSPLSAEDLHRLAWSAGLTGRDSEMLSVHERLYNALLDADQQLSAARAAFWLGFRLFAIGEPARGSGWLSRAQRLIEACGRECPEQGYMLIAGAHRHITVGELAQAQECARHARELGERFAERDLIALGLNMQGRALLADDQIAPGLALLDDAMVAATSGELSPVVTGVVYCSSIGSCQRIFALDRVREWTVALSAFCDANPQLGLFNGACLVHRAEMMELSGSWPECVDEARRAVQRCVRGLEQESAGRAHYQQAEIHRLRGELALADAAYREANRCGFEPLPGLALLRLAEGDVAAAASASRRVTGATRDPLARTRFLPAHVDIMLAAGDVEEARAASRELQQLAASLNTEVLAAIAARACAAVHFADGRAVRGS
jgi:tetratricopeptide (TPR) repeat protein